jgi:hypothetical protein
MGPTSRPDIQVFFIETVDELEESHPGIFGHYGGYSRAVAVTNMLEVPKSFDHKSSQDGSDQ